MKFLAPLRWIAKGVAGLLMILVLAVLAASLYRAWRQNDGGRILVIASPNGIDEAMFIRIGRTEQWVTIRGQDRRNPVVLILHGGPGAPSSSFAQFFLPLEQNFTIAQWDQPGAGRTFERAGRKLDPSLSIASVVSDGIAVAEFLKTHLHKDKIILLGWSWGSVLGIHMAKLRPDLLTAYVGTGQIVNMEEGETVVYQRVLAKARLRGDADAIKDLTRIGPPPYHSPQELGSQREWAAKYENNRSMMAQMLPQLLLSPRITLVDAYDILAGFSQSNDHFLGPAMNGPFMAVDLRALGLVFQVPIFIVEGTEDDYTPALLSRAYVEDIKAPQRAFIPMEGAGHQALISHSGQFARIMIEYVRPLTLTPATALPEPR